MAMLEVRSQRLHVEDNEAEAPTVLFAHGFLMDATMFDAVIDEVGARARCITLDLRGFGRTVTDGREFTLWDLALDVLAVADLLGVDRFVWCGHSQGGYAGLRAALLSQRIAGLALVNSSAAPQSPHSRAALEQVVAAWSSGDMARIATPLATSLIGNYPAAAHWARRWSDSPPRDIRNAATAVMTRDDIRPKLAEITIPATIVHGGADATVAATDVDDLAARLTGCDGVVTIDRAAHTAPLSHPREVCNALLTLIDRAPS